MNLELRNGTWYAVLVIPEDVRPQFGKFKFIKSLRTPSKAEAAFRAGPVLTGWRAEIRKARGLPFDPKETEVNAWRQELENARGHGAQIGIEDALEARAREITKSKGIDAGSNFYQAALGLVTPLDSLYKDWRAHLQLAPKTMDQMGRDVGRLVEHFGNLQRITPKAVKTWADKLTEEGATHASLKRLLGSARSFWKYLQSTSVIELTASDPFAGMLRLTATKVERNKRDRKAFSAAEVASLYAAALAKEDQPLADLIALGAYTGARIEELCSLRKEDAIDGRFSINDAKTKAGIRQVPIHPALKKLVRRLDGASTDGYLIPSKAEGKYGGRSAPLSKRFGRMKADLGFGPDQVFHSIRKTVVTLMEQAGVSEGLAADVVGHEKATMTYGLYSDGSSPKQKLGKVCKTGPVTRFKAVRQREAGDVAAGAQF